MAPPPTALTTTANRIVVPAHNPNGGGGDRWYTVIQAQAGCAAARLVHVAATGSFLCRLQWSAGGRATRLDLSASRSLKVSVFARSVEVLVQHYDAANALDVSVFIVDTYERTENHLQHLAESTGAVGPATVEIPPFAAAVRLEMDDPATYAAASFLDLYDAAGVLRSRHAGDAQPDGWVQLAGAHTLKVTCQTNHRLIFKLTL